MAKFIHLHNHTSFSLLDGACKIVDMLKLSQQFEMDSLAITDHGNMFGAIEFYTKAKKAGIKPIVGAEVYIAPKSRFDKTSSKGASDTSYHLVLLAKDYQGYQNLMKLVSIGFLEGFYYKPRIDKETLRQYSAGLVALSGCLKGEVSRLLLREDIESAAKAASEYAQLFGDDYYLEIHDHNINDEKIVLQGMAELSRSLGIPLVATNDVHYLKKEHAKAHETLLCIQTGKTLKDESRMKFSTDQVYFKSPQEMIELFKNFPDAIENTVRIAEKCNLEIETGKTHLPKFEIPNTHQNMSLDEYLRELAEQGLKTRYQQLTPELTQRLEHELKIIEKMGYAGYFLIVKDFIDYARSKQIPVGPGRGSAAGSLVAYCLRITNIDPIKYGLLFERFLNPDRISMPDIDIDFCYERREEIIKYVKEKYGDKNVTQIITFGTMAARGVIRDVGRALDISLSEVDKIAKLVPTELKMTLTKALNKVQELKDVSRKNDIYKQLIDQSLTLEGLHRHASTHAAGVVITPQELTHYTPLFKSTQGDVTTQYDMKCLETIGLLKIDFLGLRTLTVIDHTLKHLKLRGITLDIENIPLDDPKTFDLFGEGETVGIFQFESSGMRDSLRRLKPQNIGDLIAMNALYRPGPMKMIPDFIDRRHGRTNIEYLHPKLEPILRETYGVMVYQEQVMRVASDLAGFSMGKADELRSAMGKKIIHLMDKLSVEFKQGAVKNNIPVKTADDIYELMKKFAEYGFNKSHAAGYSVVAYQTAYLKAHYPAEFMAASLTSEMNDTNKIVILIEESKRLGIDVLAPDVNESHIGFTVVGNNVRFGLNAIKNVGKNAIKSIIKARKKQGKFKTIFDLCEHVDLRLVNKKVLESLIQAGALDSLEGHRAQLMAAVDIATQYSQRKAIQLANGQSSIFEAAPEQVQFSLPPIPETTRWTEKEQLTREKDVLGFYFSGHPLSRYKLELQIFSKQRLNDLEDLPDGSAVKLGVMITQVKKHFDKKNRAMAFVTIEDLFGVAEMLVFSDTYKNHSHQIHEDALLFVFGKISRRDNDDQPKIICDEILNFEDIWRRCAKQLYIKIDTDKISKESILQIKNLIAQNRGDCQIFLKVKTPNNGSFVMRSRKMSARLSIDLSAKLAEFVGSENIWIEG